MDQLERSVAFLRKKIAMHWPPPERTTLKREAHGLAVGICNPPFTRAYDIAHSR